MNTSNLTQSGQLRHFVTLAGLDVSILQDLFSKADAYLAGKAIPQFPNYRIANLFFENSTRTRCAFEVAAKRLGADVLNLNMQVSATAKGETLLDTAKNLQAMGVNAFVLRHAQSGAAAFLAQHVNVSVINAGDGCHAHPSQALLDMYTISKHKSQFENLTVAIVGDILHSRVARSLVEGLHALRVGRLRLIAPKTLLPTNTDPFGAEIYHNIETGLNDVDVIIMLRLQRERMQNGLLASESAFYKQYGLTTARLEHAKPDAIVMHPGPVNRGVEMSSTVLESDRSVVLQQVQYGVVIRMAIFATLFEGGGA